MSENNQNQSQQVLEQSTVGHGGGNEPPQEQKLKVYPFAFHGNGVDLAILILKNLILTLLTLGVYSFWGKVEVRKFIWANTDFYGGRFRYHGTGKELLVGFLMVVGFYLAFVATIAGAQLVSETLGAMVTIVLTLVIYAVIPVAIYMSRRYILSRTTWRGVNFGMDRAAKEFILVFLGGAILTGVTFGFYMPVFLNRNYKFLMEKTHFGSARIRYTGEDSEAFKLFLKYLPLIIITLGIGAFYYQAAVMRYRTERTWLGTETHGAAQGQMNLSGKEYFLMVLLNILALVCTLGLAMPWVMAHNMAFFLNRLSFVGNIEFDKIVQVEVSGNSIGEGLADALDLGFV